MTAAVASPLQAIKRTQSSVEAMIPRRENLMGNRYAWYGLDSIHHADLDAMTDGANQGRMPRLKWQPIIKAPRWVHVGALGENGAAEIVARRNPDSSGKPREEMHWIKPWAIINSLGMLYGERGLIDSPTLRYADLDTFEALHLDDIFFPENEESLPQTFKLSEKRILDQLAVLRSGKAMSPEWFDVTAANEQMASHPAQAVAVSPAAIPQIIKIGEEMLASLRHSAVYGRKVIDERHAEMEKAAAGVPGNRGTYDDRERRLLAWLEITPRNAALEKIALDSNQLPQVITQMANVVAAQAQRQPETLDVAALGEAIGGALAKQLAPLIAKSEAEPSTESVKPEKPATKAK